VEPLRSESTSSSGKTSDAATAERDISTCNSVMGRFGAGSGRGKAPGRSARSPALMHQERNSGQSFLSALEARSGSGGNVRAIPGA
jgi:hypothetical protein